MILAALPRSPCRRCGLAVNIVIAWLLLFQRRNASACSPGTRAPSERGVGSAAGPGHALISIYLLAQPVAGLVAPDSGHGHLPVPGSCARIHGVGLSAEAGPGAGWLLFDGVVTLILAS